MRKQMVLLSALMAIIYTFTFSAKENDNMLVAYPDGFRTWTHIKTGFIGPQNPSFPINGGFHHIYGNEKAVQGFSTGIFPEGSVLVFDVIEGLEHTGLIIEGKRKLVDVMQKDSVRFRDTGGWGFEEFSADSHTERKLDQAAKMQCFTCHTKQKDLVFSDLRK